MRNTIFSQLLHFLAKTETEYYTSISTEVCQNIFCGKMRVYPWRFFGCGQMQQGKRKKILW